MKNKSKPAQKVVIPIGTIDPHETTIIEIPEGLHRQPIVVAKKTNQCIDPVLDSSGTSCNNIFKNDAELNFLIADSAPDPPKKKRNKWDYFTSYDDTCPSPNSDRCNSNMQQAVNSYSNCYKNEENVIDLDQTEKLERVTLQHDLEEFQRARRRLLYNASNLAGSSILNRISSNK